MVADIGGHLKIESLQDTATYKSQQLSANASVTVGAGVSGSAGASASRVNSDYRSVTQQSGLKAGDGGFQVDVRGDTTLTGGAITSTQAAVEQDKNSFKTGGTLSTRDIENTASYDAQSVAVNVGAAASPTGKLVPGGTSAGFGLKSGNASSTTQAAISGIAGNTAARTGDAETGIGRIFNADST